MRHSRYPQTKFERGRERGTILPPPSPGGGGATEAGTARRGPVDSEGGMTAISRAFRVSPVLLTLTHREGILSVKWGRGVSYVDIRQVGEVITREPAGAKLGLGWDQVEILREN